MNYKHIISTLLVGVITLLSFSSCEDWLTQKDLMGMSPDDAYSTDQGINSIVGNLYSRLRYEQDFAIDNESYDLTRWDEAVNNSQYWAFAANVGRNYRSYYDYGLIRDINLHLEELANNQSSIPEEKYSYYVAEARFIRAFVYFTMVSRLGGVPIITEAMNYVDNPLELAKARDTEAAVYDFIASEIDDIKVALDVKSATKSQTRATKGSALALKARAMLYAGSLAYNYDKSAAKGLNLPSGATGIPKEKANDYLQKCLDACSELDGIGYYSLFQKDADRSENYYKLFITKGDNREIIFCKAYDGVNIFNYFTQRAISRSQTGIAKSGAQINPTLNLANAYELVATREVKPLDAYIGEEIVETIGTASSSYQYTIYDAPEEIFAGRDPRLAGTLLYAGSSLRDKAVDLQAGLAVLQPNGSYTFRSAQSVDAIATSYYEGEKLTGTDGPFRSGDNCWYISHSGFLLKKYVDNVAGSETQGESSVPYIVFRYGEVLLNGAEAAFLLNQNGVGSYNGQNTKTLALSYINKVRERAGGAEFALKENELTFDRIINERRVELAYEDHRYYDLKRWRIADEVWAFDRDNENAIMYGLWPYKIYAPGSEQHGKWLYRKIKIEHRGSATDKGMPIEFNRAMYYSEYPMNEGNPYIEKNPNH
ncbi:RagB/SusD family nutrient uptake outer membrane protein [Parabacteroides sp. OttesenSCG-928-N08]|nr:RagB/SusD family nutrient uptake outer membrane protein [Parabacteroides sp. OttesenSCG-928-N08]